MLKGQEFRRKKVTKEQVVMRNGVAYQRRLVKCVSENFLVPSTIPPCKAPQTEPPPPPPPPRKERYICSTCKKKDPLLLLANKFDSEFPSNGKYHPAIVKRIAAANSDKVSVEKSGSKSSLLPVPSGIKSLKQSWTNWWQVKKNVKI